MSLSSIQLEAFLALAQTRNFTKAAEKIHVTQSALSQRILNLEGELATTLFIRDRAGVQLTEVATELLRYCQMKEKLEADFLSRLQAQTQNELTGVVRISGFSSVMNSVVLASLADLFSDNARLGLESSTREMNELPDLLKKGVTDFIVLDHKLDREELVAVDLGEERNVLVEKKGYKGGDVFLDHDENDLTTLRYLKLAKRKSARIERRYLDDIHGLLEGVKLGLGRAVVPMHLIRKADGIRVIDPEVILKIPVILHYYQQPYYSKLHQSVTQALESRAPRLLQCKDNP